jgi:hypothetical protein
MSGLRGMKPVQHGFRPAPAPARKGPGTQPAPIPAAPAPAPAAQPAAETPAPAVVRTAAPAKAAAPALAPALIQLAAGMAIEVDGTLDLRGHSRADLLERLKERLLDAQVLGWRTLHLVLGPAPEPRETLLAFILSGEARVVTRYAQAPVPMGGQHAWILYFATTATAGPTHRMENA